MSDDRFTREPGDDTDEIRADRTYVDRRPRSHYEPFDLASECEKFLDEYCRRFGMPRHTKKKRDAQPLEQTPESTPTAEDWAGLAEKLESNQ